MFLVHPPTTFTPKVKSFLVNLKKKENTDISTRERLVNSGTAVTLFLLFHSFPHLKPHPLTSVYGMSLSRRVADVRTAPFPRMLLEACCASGNWGTGMAV